MAGVWQGLHKSKMLMVKRVEWRERKRHGFIVIALPCHVSWSLGQGHHNWWVVLGVVVRAIVVMGGQPYPESFRSISSFYVEL